MKAVKLNRKAAIFGATMVLAGVLAAAVGCGSPTIVDSGSTARTVSTILPASGEQTADVSHGGVIVNIDEEQAALDHMQAGAVPTMNKHLSRGVTCDQCHGTPNPTKGLASDAACRQCHSESIIVAATADVEDIENRISNPHDSHIGLIDCMLCHRNHEMSTYYCTTCHPEEEYRFYAVP